MVAWQAEVGCVAERRAMSSSSCCCSSRCAYGLLSGVAVVVHYAALRCLRLSCDGGPVIEAERGRDVGAGGVGERLARLQDVLPLALHFHAHKAQAGQHAALFARPHCSHRYRDARRGEQQSSTTSASPMACEL